MFYYYFVAGFYMTLTKIVRIHNNYPCAVYTGVVRLCPSVCMYICVCVSSGGHARLRLTTRGSPRGHSLQLLRWVCGPVGAFSVLAGLVRTAGPWLSGAACSCGGTLQCCGCVARPPVSVGVLAQSHMYRASEPLSNMRVAVMQE